MFSSLHQKKEFNSIEVGEIRELMRQYQIGFNISRLVFGYHEEAQQVDTLLRELSCESDSYKLNREELYVLFNIIKQPSHLSLITSLRQKFSSNYFFELIEAIDKSITPSRDTYMGVHELDYQGRRFIFEMFCQENSCYPLTEYTLQTIFELTDGHFYFDQVKDCFELLQKNYIYNDKTLTIMKAWKGQLLLLQEILHILDKNNLLTIRNLEKLPKDSKLTLLIELLKLLERPWLSLSLYDELCESDLTSALIENTALLKKANCLNKKTFVILKNLNHLSLLDFQHLLTPLAKANLLNEENFMLLYAKRNRLLRPILDLLVKNDLLTANVLKSIPDALLSFNTVIHYLEFSNSLDATTLQAIINLFSKQQNSAAFLESLFQSFVENNFKLHHINLNLLLKISKLNDLNNFKNVLTILSKSNILDNQKLNKLLKLNNIDIMRITHAITDLFDNKLLDLKAFNEVMHLVSTPLQPVVASSVVKIKRNPAMSKARSKLTIDEDVMIYLEHNPNKKYIYGGYGKIKKGFKSSITHESTYAVKRLLKEEEPDEALREVQYQKLLERKAYFFSRNRKKYVVSPWFSGKALNQYKIIEIRKTSLKQRLSWMIMGFEQLNQLHKRYRLHGDIKPGNFILDIEKNELHLIDFGTARMRDSNKKYAYTGQYLAYNPFYYNSKKFDFAEDIYAMGLTVAAIFPELYAIKENNQGNYKLQFHYTGPLTVKHIAIMQLVKAMMNDDASARCTVNDALSYLQKLVANLSQLTHPLLSNITKETILHTALTVDDVLHGRLRRYK